MSKNNSASIREVYAISQRLEEKIDKIETRVASMEGKITIIAIFWGSLVSVFGIFINYFLNKR